MASGSKATVIAALIGNGLITVSKITAAVLSGSTAMLAESLHSFADTSNQALLLFGLEQGKKPFDERRPLGYGREVYFWTFVVSVVIFFLGGVFAIYEGTKKAFFESGEHHAIDPTATYIVLGLSILFESYSMSVAVREFNEYRQSRPVLKTILETRDPVIPTVLFEDAAAIVGSAIALLGVWASVTFELPILDGLTSIFIGIILCVVGVFLALESRSLLIGEGASPENYEKVRRSIKNIPEIESVQELLIPQLGPEEVLVNLAVTFRSNLTTDEIAGVIDRTEAAIREEVPEARRIFIEVKSLKTLASGSPT